MRQAREEGLVEHERRVYVEADVEECVKVTGKKPIQVRWVDVDKGFGVYRSRFLTKDFRLKNKIDDREGFQAATPPLEVVKFLIMQAATKCRQEEVRKIMLIDISKANLYAPIEGEQYIHLAPERAKGWEVCKVAVHLVRVADCSQHLGAGVLSDLGGGGILLQGLPRSAHSPTPRGRVDGDDFVIEGGQEHLDWTKGVLAKRYLVNVRSIFGPERQPDKVADILNRVVEWHDDELWWEAYPRHVEKMLEDIGLGDCKPGAVPGAKRAEEQDGEQELDRETAWKYRSNVARSNSPAQDRPDIRYTVKGCAAR